MQDEVRFNGKKLVQLRIEIGRRKANQRGGKNVPVSQQWLAERLDCSVTSIGNYERGTMPNMAVIARMISLSRQFGCELDWEDLIIFSQDNANGTLLSESIASDPENNCDDSGSYQLIADDEIKQRIIDDISRDILKRCARMLEEKATNL